MHFRVSSVSACVIVLVLHFTCFTGNVTALKFSLPTALDDNENENSSTTIGDQTVMTTTDVPSTEAIAIAIETLHPSTDLFSSVPSAKSTGDEVTYDVKNDNDNGNDQADGGSAKVSPWVQKIQNVRSKSRSLEAPSTQRTTDKNLPPGGTPVTLAQVISNVLYGSTWSAAASQTNSKCADDMRAYNLHMRNFTLWAAKSKCELFKYAFRVPRQ